MGSIKKIVDVNNTYRDMIHCVIDVIKNMIYLQAEDNTDRLNDILECVNMIRGILIKWEGYDTDKKIEKENQTEMKPYLADNLPFYNPCKVGQMSELPFIVQQVISKSIREDKSIEDILMSYNDYFDRKANNTSLAYIAFWLYINREMIDQPIESILDKE